MFYDKAAKLRLERVRLRRKRHGLKLYLNVFFLIGLGFWVWSLLTQNNYKAVDDAISNVYYPPIQRELKDSEKESIEFTQNGYHYKIDPLYYYDIQAFVLSHFDYTLFALRRTDSVFPIDLCLTWGENMKKNLYKEQALSVRQDSRFCQVNWAKKTDFNMDEFSNNHLVIASKELEKKAFSIRDGDQIRVRGKLVNMKAVNVDGEISSYEFESASWGSSTTRKDTGAGACEVIWVEDIEILQRGNEFAFYAHTYSLYLVMLIIVVKMTLSFINFNRNKKNRAQKGKDSENTNKFAHYKSYSPLGSLRGDSHATTRSLKKNDLHLQKRITPSIHLTNSTSQPKISKLDPSVPLATKKTTSQSQTPAQPQNLPKQQPAQTVPTQKQTLVQSKDQSSLEKPFLDVSSDPDIKIEMGDESAEKK